MTSSPPNPQETRDYFWLWVGVAVVIVVILFQMGVFDDDSDPRADCRSRGGLWVGTAQGDAYCDGAEDPGMWQIDDYTRLP